MGTDIQRAPVSASRSNAPAAKEDASMPAHPPTSEDLPDLETSTRSWGRRIFSEIHEAERRHPGGFFHRRLLRLLGEDEALRFALLRFVDVYPALNTHAEIAGHLRDYVSTLRREGASPGFAASFVYRLMATSLAPDPWVAQACGAMIERMGRRLIAGETPDEIASRLHSLEAQGLRFSLDLLGEHVASREQADAFARRYATIIESLPEQLGDTGVSGTRTDGDPRINLSIKLSALTHRFDPLDPEGTTRRVLKRLQPLLLAARRRRVFVNVDMERYAFRDLTLDIVRALLTGPDLRGYPHVGVVMQAYLRDAEPALRDWLAWLKEANQPMTIRLVKGAYWDSEQIWAAQKGWPTPVHLRKADSDLQFERMTRILLDHRPLVRTAVASHNVRSVAHALALREKLGIGEEGFECQLLYGMADDLAAALVHMGIPVRIYTPCGELVEGMSYLVRRILENTANTSFLRHAALRDIDEEALLDRPESEETA
jgi:RHH-type proline utilization regulon transcriptional repressor/proline dehydrogenase/delta 1-pyrroline-5-carboxylate dehydrogenase